MYRADGNCWQRLMKSLVAGVCVAPSHRGAQNCALRFTHSHHVYWRSPGFGFPVAEPSLWKEGYEVDLPPGLVTKLGASRDCECVILIITTIHPGGTRVTGNLLAPLVINAECRLGAQLTLPDETLSVREEIDYLKFGLAVGTAAEDNSVEAPAAHGGQRETAEEDAQEVSLR